MHSERALNNNDTANGFGRPQAKLDTLHCFISECDLYGMYNEGSINNVSDEYYREWVSTHPLAPPLSSLIYRPEKKHLDDIGKAIWLEEQ